MSQTYRTLCVARSDEGVLSVVVSGFPGQAPGQFWAGRAGTNKPASSMLAVAHDVTSH